MPNSLPQTPRSVIILQHYWFTAHALAAHLSLSCCLLAHHSPIPSATWSRAGSVSSLLTHSLIPSLARLLASSFACLCIHLSTRSLAHRLRHWSACFPRLPDCLLLGFATWRCVLFCTITGVPAKVYRGYQKRKEWISNLSIRSTII